MTKIYARPGIHDIAGYIPGEQPQDRQFIKLNTNENPYPPSPKVGEALAALDWQRLRLYPEPSARPLRQTASEIFGVPMSRIICGNGSDDLLTIALRTFVDAGKPVAFTDPSYSLYPILAGLQGALKRPVELADDYSLTAESAIRQAGDAALLLIARPNAPTGTTFDREEMRKLARGFGGVLWIDEAYADFAEDNCLGLVDEFPNVVVSRTFSKSYSLAGLRLGLAFAQESLIEEMFKLKDSYNVDAVAQAAGAAALSDQSYLLGNVARIRETRAKTASALTDMGWTVLPSQANFLFAKPAHLPAGELFARLKDEGILVRYFALPRVSDYLRITIGTAEQMQTLLAAVARLDK